MLPYQRGQLAPPHERTRLPPPGMAGFDSGGLRIRGNLPRPMGPAPGFGNRPPGRMPFQGNPHPPNLMDVSDVSSPDHRFQQGGRPGNFRNSDPLQAAPMFRPPSQMNPSDQKSNSNNHPFQPPWTHGSSVDRGMAGPRPGEGVVAFDRVKAPSCERLDQNQANPGGFQLPPPRDDCSPHSGRNVQPRGLHLPPQDNALSRNGRNAPPLGFQLPPQQESLPPHSDRSSQPGGFQLPAPQENFPPHSGRNSHPTGYQLPPPQENPHRSDNARPGGFQLPFPRENPPGHGGRSSHPTGYQLPPPQENPHRRGNARPGPYQMPPPHENPPPHSSGNPRPGPYQMPPPQENPPPHSSGNARPGPYQMPPPHENPPPHSSGNARPGPYQLPPPQENPPPHSSGNARPGSYQLPPPRENPPPLGGRSAQSGGFQLPPPQENSAPLGSRSAQSGGFQLPPPQENPVPGIDRNPRPGGFQLPHPQDMPPSSSCANVHPGGFQLPHPQDMPPSSSCANVHPGGFQLPHPQDIPPSSSCANVHPGGFQLSSAQEIPPLRGDRNPLPPPIENSAPHSGRKTLLAVPPPGPDKAEPVAPSDQQASKRGILPAPESLINQPASSTAASTTTSSKSITSSVLLPPPVADISRPPPGFEKLTQDADSQSTGKSEPVNLPHPSSFLATNEPVPVSSAPVVPSDFTQPPSEGIISRPNPDESLATNPSNERGDESRPSLPSTFPPLCTAVPPPPMHQDIPQHVVPLPFGVPPQPAVGKNFSYPPPPTGDASLITDVSVPPHLPPSHPPDLSVPPPGLTILPPPEPHHNLPPLHLPPPGYSNVPKASESLATAASGETLKPGEGVGEDEYARELVQWHKQIEDYERQMVEYFQKCRDRLLEIYPSDVSTADEGAHEAYRREYNKLQEEYENFNNYMQPMRDYYSEASAELAKETGKVPTEAIAELPSLPPPISSQEPPPPPPPPPPSEPVPAASIPAPPTNDEAAMANALTQLASDYSEVADDANNPAAQYYSQYYRQMIDYYQQLLKSMRGGDGGSSSGDDSDEDMKNLNKNQRKKLRKKKKLKKKLKEGTEAGNASKVQQDTSQGSFQNQQFQQSEYAQQQLPQQQEDAWNWSNWYGYPIGSSAAGEWTSVPPPPVDHASLGTGMEWQEVAAKSSTIQQQVALTNQQLMAHPTVADGVAGYGAAIPAPENMSTVGVGADSAGGANVEPLQPHMSAVINHARSLQEAASLPPPPPPLAQAQPGSIFAEESKDDKKDAGDASDSDDEDDDDEGDWSYCVTCDQKFTSERAYTVHLRGVKHMQNALEKAQKKDPDKFKEERDAEIEAIKKEEDPEKKHLEWIIQQSVKRRGLGSMGSYFCELCNVECTSEKALAMHLNGTKHALRVDQLKSGTATAETLAQVEEKRVVRKRAQLRIQGVLDQCLEALIGLNYVTEYQRVDSMAECRYHCQLCDFRFSQKTFINHVTGIRHRKNFIKYNYPDLYEILDQDSSVKAARTKRIDIYARKIEEYEGRKRVSIKTEITDEGRKKEAKRERLEKEFKEEQKKAEEEQEAKAEEEVKVKMEAEEADMFFGQPRDMSPDEVRMGERNFRERSLSPMSRAHLDSERERWRRHKFEEHQRAADLRKADETRRRRHHQQRKAKSKKAPPPVENDADLEEGEIASDDEGSLSEGEVCSPRLSPPPMRPDHRRGYPPEPFHRGPRNEYFDEGGYGRRRIENAHMARPHPLRFRRLEPVRPGPSGDAVAKKAEESSERKEADDVEEEEPGLADMEDVEYEDAYVSERPPMTFQLKEDTERDEFIRGIKERKMLRLREVTKEAIEQFTREADWVLARRRKTDEAAKAAAAEEKRRWLERLRKDEAVVLGQKGGAKGSGARHAGNAPRLLLPELRTEAGPSVQASDGGGGFAGPIPEGFPGEPLKEGQTRPVDPAMQSLMQNITQMTGLGLLPPPAQVWGEQQNPEHVAELIDTMKTLMRRFEAGGPGNRPSPLLPPPAPQPPSLRKPPMLLPLTKRRRLLGDLLPDVESGDEGPLGKRPRPGLGLLPHPGEPASRRTLLGQAPGTPRKTLLGEKPESSGPSAGASYNKKVLFPTGPSKSTEEGDPKAKAPLLATPSEPPAGPKDDEGEEIKGVDQEEGEEADTSSPPDKPKAKPEEGEKEEEKAKSVAERFKAASGVKTSSKEDAPEEGEKGPDSKGMEEGELEDDEEDDAAGSGGFFDGYSLWRPGMTGPPVRHGGFFPGPRARSGDDDEEHLRQLLKKAPDFKVAQSLRRLAESGHVRGAGNLSAIAKLLGLNEPRPQHPPTSSPGKLPDIDVGQLKAILSNVHQRPHPFLPGPPPFLRHPGPPPSRMHRGGPPEPK